MWPTLYTEHDLTPPPERAPGAVPSPTDPALLERWLAAASPDVLRRQVADALRALGFDWMSLASIDWRDGTPVATRLLCSHAHARWTEAYFGEGRAWADPRLPLALASALPLAWSIDRPDAWLDTALATPEQLRFPALLRDAGIGSGLIVQVRGTDQSNGRSLVSLSARRADIEWMNEAVIGRVMMFARCLHELCTVRRGVAPAHDTPAANDGALASPTRREILRHLAQGRSNKQIAYRLQLSADTVKYHLRELRRHFNVRNRIELLNSHRLRAADGRP
jgi:DNA-binding CsgD family transcriptional regulator